MSEDRFANWKMPEIEDGKPTKWMWIVKGLANFKLGRRVDIGSFTYIQADAGVTLEDEVEIGGGSMIYSVSTIDHKRAPVTLKRNCKVGAQSTVMPGVTIGENSVIGAHSLVKSDIPANSVAWGVPARVTGTIKDGTITLFPKGERS